MRNLPDTTPFGHAAPSENRQAMTILRHRRRCLFGLLALMLLALALPGTAFATCWFTSGSATTVTFNAGTITLTPSTQVGSVLWTSGEASPANPPYLSCDGNTNGGIVNTIAGQTPVNGDNTLIPTGIPGISYRLLHPNTSTKLALYPNYPTDDGTFNIASNLQLVYTGPYLPPNNSTLAGQLAQWKVDTCNGAWTWSWNTWSYYCKGGTVAPRPVEIFNISAIIHIQVPTCDIAPSSISKTVSLPAVNTNQFVGSNPTPGNTPFDLQLINCPNNLGVVITLSASNPWSGGGGVINNTQGSGYAQGVGVQVLWNNAPVTFNSPINPGTTSGSNYTINLSARYYKTGNVTAGNVKAVATYTMNYQ